MNTLPVSSRLAVCSWSLQPTSPADLLAKLQQTGLRRVQLALDPLRESPETWGQCADILRSAGMEIVSGMFGCVGEDYTTLDSIRVTGGIAPDSTWEQNLKNIRATATLAKGLGLRLVTFHAGFVPDDEANPGFAKMLERLRAVADIFSKEEILLGLETGQETAPALRHLLGALARPNITVNFDPANMLLYAKGDPIKALEVLGPSIRQVHIKDARRTKVPGTWGEEVCAGTGEVDWPAFFSTLGQAGFTGDFVIEREAGNQRVADIQAARAMVESVAAATPSASPRPTTKRKSMSTNQNPDRKVNVAVVGLGFMGVTHLRAYLGDPAARVVAVCDSVRLPVNGVLEGVAGNVKKIDPIDLGPTVKVYRKLEEVLADPDVELVDLCTPTPLHADQAVAALQAGKNVFCEKPMARTSEAARKIVEAERAGRSFLMPAMCMRFWPGWSWLKKVVEEKTYGQVMAARFRRMSEMPGWSKQGTYADAGNDLGGALFDLHIHDTDFVQFLFGKPKAVFSTGLARPGGSVDHVVTQYIYPGGPLVYAEGSWLLTKGVGFQMAYTLHCERATLEFDLARGADPLLITEEGQAPRVMKFDGPDGYSNEIRYVLECAARRSRPKIVTAKDGLNALKICEAEEKSVKTGKKVTL